MNNETKFTPKDLDEELVKAKMLERMHDVIETAISKGFSAREALEIMTREIHLIRDEVLLHNKKAHNNIVCRELGVDDSAVIPQRQYLCALMRGSRH
ncbi:conserved hypothetical protein [Escherichia phage D108]|uniref:Uncharacterized protein gp14 n=1 Tax=Escherichia phage D108 TaxID=665033 RepID=E15_BPD10|nr:hypothetical protein EP-D108_gp14 [Escherichia phage D108]P24795.1 RecName: Full=Uncharacterized protein gp14; AltName: Full=E15; AltName: Full=Gene product 14; Short=gp14 [Escherichia phage D108]ACV50273.1 conserved hypothetical protein [Escherichia phage D108]CAA38197.1 unnamed protein product [Escherichia phage D108]